MTLTEEIEELKEEIADLKIDLSEAQDDIDNHSDEMSIAEEDGYDRAMLEIESKIDHSFNAGYDACLSNSGKLKGLLNYKMELRL